MLLQSLDQPALKLKQRAKPPSAAESWETSGTCRTSGSLALWLLYFYLLDSVSNHYIIDVCLKYYLVFLIIIFYIIYCYGRQVVAVPVLEPVPGGSWPSGARRGRSRAVRAGGAGRWRRRFFEVQCLQLEFMSFVSVGDKVENRFKRDHFNATCWFLRRSLCSI